MNSTFKNSSGNGKTFWKTVNLIGSHPEEKKISYFVILTWFTCIMYTGNRIENIWGERNSVFEEELNAYRSSQDF